MAPQDTKQALEEAEQVFVEATESATMDTLVPAKKPKDISRFTKKKFKWKKWLFWLVILGVIGYFVFKTMTKGPELQIAQGTALTKGDLSNRVTLTGQIESGDSAEIYARYTGGYVEKVNVQVGDRVEAGAILAQLDTDDLEMSIVKQQAAIERLEKTNDFSNQLAEKEYESARVDLAAGLNADIVSAQSSLDRAQRNLNDARREYNESKDDREYGDDLLRASQKQMERARDAYNTANKKYQQYKLDIGENPSADQSAQLERLAEDVEAKESEYLTKVDLYWNVYNQYDDQLSSEAKSLHAAQLDYQNALDSKQVAENRVDRSIESLKDQLARGELNGDMTIEQLTLEELQRNLSDATVTAPISGTVTAVYAKEGVPGTGLLFVIEDTENMMIKTSVKEYDIGSIVEGMQTEVKSDATGEKTFEGKIEKIYPTAMKGANGATKTTSGIEFETDVALEDAEGLRVGMNVRLNVTTSEKKDVFSVPFEAVTTNGAGKDVVLTADPNEEGAMVLREIEVTTGMETSFALEVSGEGLTEGMQIIANPTGLQAGMTVMLIPDTASGAAADGATAGAAMMAG